MKYVLAVIMYAILVGPVVGWAFYNACGGPKKDRLCASIIWGAGIAMIFVFSAIWH